MNKCELLSSLIITYFLKHKQIFNHEDFLAKKRQLGTIKFQAVKLK